MHNLGFASFPIHPSVYPSICLPIYLYIWYHYYPYLPPYLPAFEHFYSFIHSMLTEAEVKIEIGLLQFKHALQTCSSTFDHCGASFSIGCTYYIPTTHVYCMTNFKLLKHWIFSTLNPGIRSKPFNAKKDLFLQCSFLHQLAPFFMKK